MKKKLDSSYNLINQTDINELFSQITLQEVEQFYKTYQLWLKHQQIAHTQQKINALREQQAQNAARMNDAAPSAVALSTLAQLRASGVEDVDLLDRMLERGEEWLDHTIELLERCEELNVIRGNYTQWCEHALEGAYEWMGSMDDASLHDYFHAEAAAEDITPAELINFESDPTDIVTEDQLLRKLMSEDGIVTKRKTVPLPRITQDLPPLEVHEEPEAVEAQADADQDFPVEIEEPEIASDTSAIEELARASSDEQQAQYAAAQQGESEEHLEEFFPVEIAEPALTMSEIAEPALATTETTGQESFLPLDTEENALASVQEEVHEPHDQSEMSQDTAAETDADISIDEPVATADVAAVDEPVHAVETLPESEPIELDAPVSEESEPSIYDTVETPPSAELQTDEPVVEAYSDTEMQTTEDDTQKYHIPEPLLTETEEALPNPAVDSSTESEMPEDTVLAPTPEAPAAETLESATPIATETWGPETQMNGEVAEDSSESTAVETPETTAQVDTADQPAPTTDPTADSAIATTNNDAATTTSTDPDATTTVDASGKQESAAQWPFVYQEIQDTPLPVEGSQAVAVPNETSIQAPASKRQTKKKPRKEASRKAVKKKPGIIRRLLARLFRR